MQALGVSPKDHDRLVTNRMRLAMGRWWQLRGLRPQELLVRSDGVAIDPQVTLA